MWRTLVGMGERSIMASRRRQKRDRENWTRLECKGVYYATLTLLRVQNLGATLQIWEGEAMVSVSRRSVAVRGSARIFGSFFT